MFDYAALDTPATFRQVNVGGLSIVDADRQSVADHIVQRMAEGFSTKVAFFNSNLLVGMRRAGLTADSFGNFLFLNDGIAASAAAALVTGSFFENNLNGTDFTPYLLDKVAPGTRVFLYGGQPDVATRAAHIIAERYPVEVVGTLDGYSTADEDAAAIIAEAQADLVLVALGNPKQERWMQLYGDQLGASVVMGVGALFDFLAQRVRRAPMWMRRCRLEWAFRLLQEPRRLLARYSVDMVQFFIIVLRERRTV